MNFLSYIKKVFCRKVIHTLSLIPYTLSLILFASLLSCSDDQIFEDGQESTESTELTGDEMTFYINAGSGFSTRYATQSDAERYENTVSSIRILFFEAETGKDYYLFEAPKVSSPNKQFDEEGNEIYKVTIKISDIKDDNGNNIASQIREQFKKAPFKVAFLVNWKSNPSDWTYSNSKLNSQANDEDLYTIHDLHYIRNDNNTVSKVEFITKDSKSGEYESWYKQRNSTEEYNVEGITPSFSNDGEENAAVWIRTYWSPMHDYDYQHGTIDKPVYRKYTNLWKLWNFGGSFANNNIGYDQFGEGAESWSSEWMNRNADEFKKNKENNGGKWLGEYGNGWILSQEELDGLTVVPFSNTTDQDKVIRSFNRLNYHGIILPPVENLSNNNSKKYVGDNTKGYLTFTQESSGHLNIYYSSFGGQEQDGGNDNAQIQSSTLKIYRGQTDLNESGYTTKKIPKAGNSSITDDIEVKSIEIKITGDPEPIYIFTAEDSSNSIVIYAIEFVSDIYLSDTNREGKIPTESGIGMYGVQEFDKFSSWANGETKDLSETPISLIRSVAKVEVYLPKKASQIFMRSMNSSARYEPSDVATNTSDTWTKVHKGSNSEKDCEWYRIQSYTPWYGNGKSSKEDYESWMKWFYGTWTDRLKWTDVPSTTENGDYPHIFNPRILRSDFTEFIYVGEVNGAHKYILYVPEKAIDDPDDYKTPTSDPKVIHVEYRYSDITNNLDDNNCYRIYFTNYTDDSSLGPKNTVIKSIGKTGYEDYEKNGENLKYHWPILRNHIYRFFVLENDGSNMMQVINAKIKPWDYEPDDSWEEFW